MVLKKTFLKTFQNIELYKNKNRIRILFIANYGPTRGKQFNTMIEMIGDVHVNTHKKTGKHVYVQ